MSKGARKKQQQRRAALCKSIVKRQRLKLNEHKKPITRFKFSCVCAICKEVLLLPVTALCGHTFCEGCMRAERDSGRRCYYCQGSIECISNTDILVQDVIEKLLGKNVREQKCQKPSYLPYCLRSNCNAYHKPNAEYCSTLQANDFECVICGQCLRSPVTTTCGHTFCRECLARVLDHGLSCPLCMYPLTPIELHRNENHLLNAGIFEYAYGELLQRILHEQCIRTLETIKNEIPVFICTSAFPKVACPLHVYEPKYRLLARRCMQSITKQFGMAARSKDGSKFALYGTLLEICDSISLEDGTSIMTTVGMRRFKVLSRNERDGYDTASVEYFNDTQVAKNKLCGLKKLHERVYSETIDWLQSLKPCLLAELEPSLGTMPDIEDEWFALPDGPAWTWWLIAILPLGAQLRVGFLASTSLEKRLLAVEKILVHLRHRMNKASKGLKYHNPEDQCQTCIRSVNDMLYYIH